MLTIRVGSVANCRSFLVHESFLIARSGFFRRALNGKWAKTKTQTINLTEDDPDTFALYLNHLYNNELPTMDFSEEDLCVLTLTELRKFVDTEYMALFKLYILAEKLQDSRAKVGAITAIFKISCPRHSDKLYVLPRLSVIDLVYSHTPEGSVARFLIADMWSTASASQLEYVGLKAPKEFLLDLALVLRSKLPKRAENLVRRNGVEFYLEVMESSQ
jgi:hypothetical protein